jgi:hypothetical protein
MSLISHFIRHASTSPRSICAACNKPVEKGKRWRVFENSHPLCGKCGRAHAPELAAILDRIAPGSDSEAQRFYAIRKTSGPGCVSNSRCPETGEALSPRDYSVCYSGNLQILGDRAAHELAPSLASALGIAPPAPAPQPPPAAPVESPQQAAARRHGERVARVAALLNLSPERAALLVDELAALA